MVHVSNLSEIEEDITGVYTGIFGDDEDDEEEGDEEVTDEEDDEDELE